MVDSGHAPTMVGMVWVVDFDAKLEECIFLFFSQKNYVKAFRHVNLRGFWLKILIRLMWNFYVKIKLEFFKIQGDLSF